MHNKKSPAAIKAILKNEAQIAPFFDENYYALTADAKKLGLSPLEHYLQVGEALGIAPSRLFDPQ
ncbi:hypothetical protein EY01_15820, partial [Staphylococcus aureus]